MLLLIVNLEAKKGKQDEVLAVFNNLVAPSQAEGGCIEYVLYHKTDSPTTFVLVEKWKDQAALDYHKTLPHYTENLPKLGALLESPPVMTKYHVSIGA